MATTLSSLAIVPGGALRFRRNTPQLSPAIKVVSLLSSRSHIGSGLRFGNALQLHKTYRSWGFASEKKLNIEPPNATKSDSSDSDRPPLATILAGIVVFLLLLLVVGTFVLWIVGLIVNVPKS